MATPDTLFVLVPNQHIGVWRVGFMPQWLCREYLARRGSSRFRPDQIMPSRCPLLGYQPTLINIEGTVIPKWFFEVEQQHEVGLEGYDKGAEQLNEFFKEQLELYRESKLLPLGHEIIKSCLAGAKADDYEEFSRRA